MANEFFVTNNFSHCLPWRQSFTFYAFDSISGNKLPVFDLVCSVRYNDTFGQFGLFYFSENAEHCV